MADPRRSTRLHPAARHQPGPVPGFVHLAVSGLGMGCPVRRLHGLCLCLPAGWMPSTVRREAARRGFLSRWASERGQKTGTKRQRGRPSFRKTAGERGIDRAGRTIPREKTGTPYTNQPLRTLLLLRYLSGNAWGQSVDKVGNGSASGSASACRSDMGVCSPPGGVRVLPAPPTAGNSAPGQPLFSNFPEGGNSNDHDRTGSAQYRRPRGAFSPIERSTPALLPGALRCTCPESGRKENPRPGPHAVECRRLRESRKRDTGQRWPRRRWSSAWLSSTRWPA